MLNKNFGIKNFLKQIHFRFYFFEVILDFSSSFSFLKHKEKTNFIHFLK